jgi:DNA transformation protein and related proteins
MAVRRQFLDYVLEQLAPMPAMRPHRMFNGVGLYSNEVFFALIHEDTLYFKTGESNIAAYRERGMARFRPFPDRPETALGYHQVPAEVLEDPESLVEWARESVKVALARAATRRKTPAKNVAKRALMKPAKKRAKKPAKKSVGKPANPARRR